MSESDEPGQPIGEFPDISPPSVTAQARLTLLRWLAVIGTAAVFLYRVTSLWHIEARQEYGIVVLVLATIAVGLTCLVLLPAATGKLARHLDLLLPLGLYLSTEGFLDALMAIPVFSAVFLPSWNLQLLSLSFSLSLIFLLHIALAILYAGWTTVLIVQATGQDHVDPLDAIQSARHWFWRVAGAEVFGWVVLFAVLAVVITVGVVVLPLALIVLAIFSLVWNLATAALLLVMASTRTPFGATLREGMRVGWEGKSRWWAAVVAQMVLLGWITFFFVSYASNPRPGSFSTQNKSDFSINAFWTGGYEDECHWNTKLMAAVEAKPLPLVELLLGIVYAVLAIVVKLQIAACLYQHPPETAPDD